MKQPKDYLLLVQYRFGAGARLGASLCSAAFISVLCSPARPFGRTSAKHGRKNGLLMLMHRKGRCVGRTAGRCLGLLIASGSAAWSPIAASPPIPAAIGPEERASGQTMIIAPAETLGGFRPLVPDHPDGPNIMVIEGDPATGPSVAMFRYRNNYEGSRKLHVHTHTYRSLLIEGVMKHWSSEGSEDTASLLRPGSYWRQPGGSLHADHCVTERCVALVIFDGPIDAQF